MEVLNMAIEIKKEKKKMNFAIAYDLIIANTFYRKKVSPLVTFNSDQYTG
jgi:hypothetical protein